MLLENREWSEGLVAQYHRSSGKHCVEFRHSGARRWLLMLRTAFYIVDRGTCDEETKEPEGLPVLRKRARRALDLCRGFVISVREGSVRFTPLLRGPDAGDGPQDARPCLCDG